MAKFQFKGLEMYIFKLDELSGDSEEIIDKAIQSGAGLIADAIRQNIERLPVVKQKKWASKENPLNGISSVQKTGLLNSLGISPLEYKNGMYDRKVGFDGYNKQITLKYPKGQPNILIARSIEKGTSFRKPLPFVDPAVKANQKAVEKKMDDVLNEEIGKIIGRN